MRLLVSVRNASEALAALEGGAEFIDIKEPTRGALGRADNEKIAEIIAAVGGRVPISVALGEWTDNADSDMALPPGVQFAKFGLSGAALRPDWEQSWAASLRQLPCGTQPVAVVYADWQTCAAPLPNLTVQAAAKAGCAAVLVDTFDKSQGGLLGRVSLPDLATLIRGIHRRGMLSALGGSLDATAVWQVAPLRPSLLAVRTIVCAGGRTGNIDAGRVRGILETIAKANGAATLIAAQN